MLQFVHPVKILVTFTILILQIIPSIQATDSEYTLSISRTIKSQNPRPRTAKISRSKLFEKVAQDAWPLSQNIRGPDIGLIHTGRGPDAQCNASKWDLLLSMGVFTLLASNKSKEKRTILRGGASRVLFELGHKFLLFAIHP